MLCPGCGNEIDETQACPICTNQAAPRPKKTRSAREPMFTADSETATSFCNGCGNTIYGTGPCEICDSSAAPRARRPGETQLCVDCGNEVADAHDCPICNNGRGGGRAKRGTFGVPVCLNCDEMMAEESWDGVAVHMCISCQAVLFPPRALEAILDKLRDATEDLDFTEVLSELRNLDAPRRFEKSIRYRDCPVCDEMMTRVNYGKASGIIVEQCTRHGIWLEQRTFAELTDWISRGGDQLTRRAETRNSYEGPRFQR